MNSSSARPVTDSDAARALALPGGAPASDGAYVGLLRELLHGAADLTVSARVRWSGDKSLGNGSST
ncbi:hypothetical protein [Streptomyces sp. NPDC096013]|uniref:hypothetical protein n=1 Tax=Streptomyces sp. NPDC096013 TaxID=3366069 RepID=UPI0037FFB084